MGTSFDLERFRRLQQRLGALFDHEADPTSLTIVVVPSMSLHSDELKKISGAMHFEQRLLFQLQLLRQPQTRMVYITSQKIDPVIVDYTIDLIPSLSNSDARRRLTLMDCDDDSPDPLTAKILRRPELIEKILRSIMDVSRAYLVTYTSTSLERELALRLGIPMFSCDPELWHLGTKSGGRRLLREAGVPVPQGFEDLRHESDLVQALAGLKSANPHLTRAVVKLNDSFAGGGNATFSYAGAPSIDIAAWIAAELSNRLDFADQGETWPSYSSKFQTMGGIAECYIDAPGTRSPSVQMEISPRSDVRVLSTHDQVLEGIAGQTFVGCAFPARELYRPRIQELALRAGRALAAKGVIGQLSVDFLADESEPGGRVHALEINLRMGGATAPYFFLHGLVGGRYACESGNYLTPEGQPQYYVASDRLQRDSFRILAPRDVIDIAIRHRLHYSRETRAGAIFYMLGTLPEFGKIGVIAIGCSPDGAQRLYHILIATLEAEGYRRQTSRPEAATE
jgi:hypothetical protein